MIIRTTHPNPLFDGPTIGIPTARWRWPSSNLRPATAGNLNCFPVRAETYRAERQGHRYERVEMETKGAYKLIDRDTGESVIVWGDGDESESIPSENILSWRSQRRDGKREASEKGLEGKTASQSVTEGFGKLKVQKVKALIKRSSSQIRKEKTVTTRRAPPPRDRSYKSEEEPEDNFTNDSVQRAKSQIRKEKTVTTRRAPSPRDRSYESEEEPEENFTNDRVQRAKSQDRDYNSLRGWGAVSDANRDIFDRRDQQRRNFRDRGFFSKKSFKELGCTDDMINALKSLVFLRPSHIQAMAYGPVLQGKSCIIADQSGSGKTLAYLAPVIQCLRQDEILGQEKSQPRCPRVIVLAPTAELASQVLNNCRAISKSGMPFRSMVATGGYKQKTQLDSLEEGLDILIATPGRFLYLFQEGFVQLTNLKCVVLDEVDILFGEEGFEEVLKGLIGSAPVTAQYLFVTATLPVDIYNKVVEIFPDCEVLMGPGMHRTSSGLDEVLVDCSGAEEEEKTPETAFSNKKNALLRLVQESPVPKTIIFCNKIETCRKVENVLKRIDRKEARIRVLPFHAALTQDKRLANMKEFLKSQSADSMFLICTDRASRGIDFTRVDHVILFDFPRDPSEYVRRVGRTARGAGGIGQAYVFVVGKQVSIARRIMDRNRKGHPLHDVPCAYELGY